jgi:hypothetical protein
MIIRNFRTTYIYLQVLSLCLLLGNCNSQEQKGAKVKALVILVSDLQGKLFQEQNAVIAFKDSQDSVHVERVVLPDFERPAFPGDSLEVFRYPAGMKFGKLYKYPYSIKKRYMYVLSKHTVTKKALFDNGVLTIGTFDTTGHVSSMEFYTYKAEPEDNVKIYPIGFPSDAAFLMEGDLGGDSLSVTGYNDVYYHRAIN